MLKANKKTPLLASDEIRGLLERIIHLGQQQSVEDAGWIHPGFATMARSVLPKQHDLSRSVIVSPRPAALRSNAGSMFPTWILKIHPTLGRPPTEREAR